MTQTPFRPLAQRGFTLVELMITVVIAVLLASVAIPSYQSYVAKQRVSAAQSDLTALALSLDGHLLNNTTYPATAANTTAVKQALPAWSPVQAADFTYALVAVDNFSFPPSYTVRATGTSKMVSGCVVELSSGGTRTKSACPGGATTW